MKKLLFILMLAVLPAMASAYDAKIDDIYYNFDQSKKTAEVTFMCTYYEWENNQDAYSGAVNIPGSVKYNGVQYSVSSIGEYAFEKCSSLTSITIPNSVTSIGDHAFANCTSLTSVTISSSVTSIGGYTFYGCTSLTSITIPNSVTSIGASAFSGCSGLTSVTIPNSVTSMGNGAFFGCSGLTSITIPNSVTSIGDDTFCNCKSLTSVTIPNSVESIGEYAFQSCPFTTIAIPSSVKSIDKYAFAWCSNLTTVISFILNPFVIDTYVFYAIPYSTATLYVPKGTKDKYKATSAWNQFQKIEEIEIDLTGIEIDGIYYNLNTETMAAEVTNRLGGVYEGGRCYSGNVDIPSTVSFYGLDFSVKAIGYQAFVDCEGLTSVTIPNSVTSIGGYAFYKCRGLTSVTIPNSVTSIEESAFSNCSGLTSVTIPGSVKSLGAYVFYECTGLTSAKFESGVTSISNGIFSECNYLSSVTIPEGVTSIGADAFNRCWYLSSITIPKSVKHLGTLFIFMCERLTSITSLITEPFETNEEVFWVNDAMFANATLYVPKGTKAKYQATSAWKYFEKIEEIVVKGDVNDDSSVDVADIATIIDVMAGKAPEYKDKADVNKDITVDVADIAIIIDIMAGKDVDIPEEQAYPYCPNSAHPHWIDLALPSGTKWACCNQGANKPEDYGEYYTFDEAQAYNPPSLEQINELFDNATSEWTTQNGVNGWMFKGKVNYASVFLPAAGAVWGGEIDGDGSYGDYWSSKLSESNQRNAYYLEFGSAGASWNNIGNRNGGQSVRPVR